MNSDEVVPIQTDSVGRTSSAETRRVIKTVTVLSTGSGEVHPEHHGGSWLPQLWWVLTSRQWIEIPINFFVIEHRDGLVLFDTGLDPAIASDPNYISSPIGRFLLRKIFRLHICDNDRLDKTLRDAGFSAEDVGKAVFSHLHFDHIGGIAHIPQAELIVSRDEWNLLSGPHPEREWIFREHIKLPTAKWHPVEFMPSDDPLLTLFGSYYDVMGDGSLILLPTPGHTAGSISMLVRSGYMPPLLLIGDLAYSVELLMNDTIPGSGNARLLLQSYAKVRELKEKLPELVIVASHDPRAGLMLKTAMEAVNNPERA